MWDWEYPARLIWNTCFSSLSLFLSLLLSKCEIIVIKLAVFNRPVSRYLLPPVFACIRVTRVVNLNIALYVDWQRPYLCESCDWHDVVTDCDAAGTEGVLHRLGDGGCNVPQHHPVQAVVHWQMHFTGWETICMCDRVLLSGHMGSYMVSWDDLSPFLEGGCCYARWTKMVLT